MALLAAALVALPAIGCDRQAGLAGNVPSGHGEGRLQARPEAGPVGRRLPQGLQRFGPGQPGRGILYVSRSYSPARPAALVLVLHGAGGNGVNAVKRLVPIAREKRRRPARCEVARPNLGLRPRRIWAGRRLRRPRPRARLQSLSHRPVARGGLGVLRRRHLLAVARRDEGDLFRHVVAFSPGFADLEHPHGSPEIFITHGIEDRTLPIDRTSRQIVPELEDLGLRVSYHEFRGGHEIPDALVPRALAWLGGHVEP